MKIKTLLAICIVATLFSCSSKGEKKEVENASNAALSAPVHFPSIPHGRIVNPVVCANDASQSYAAYLPSTYDSTKKYPVIFAFDAHAGGRIPIELYSSLCEKYGYILVASNNSKNGLDAATLASIAAAFIGDVKARVSYDPNRLYLTGFSGGARVAANLALQGGYAGLASCSAGFQFQPAVPFNFIGFAGTEDFNSNEMLELNKQLDQTTVKHHLILFEGKHEWPSATVFENAFLWFEFSAMENKLIPLDTLLIQEFRTKQSTKIESLKRSGKIYETYVEAGRTIDFIGNLSDCANLISIRNALQKSTALISVFNEKAALAKRESEKQNYYRGALQQKDSRWWFTEIDKLAAQAKDSKNSHEEKLFYKRTLSFLSLLMYMAANSTLTQNQLPLAAQFLQLYEKVDPENSEVYYMQSMLAAKQQRPQLIFPLLQKAVKNGFLDSERLVKDELFKSLQTSTEFQQLLEQIKKGKS